MHLIVGLGNPGGKYAGNRHNVGFMALDASAEDWRETILFETTLKPLYGASRPSQFRF